MRTALILISTLILSSCSCEYHYNRAIYGKCLKVVRDTIKVIDTIRISEVKHDTAFNFSSSKDTVVIDKGRLTMKYYYSNDTVYLSGKCKDSVIIREVQVPIDNQVKVEQVGWDKMLFWVLLGVVFTLLIVIWLRK
jgi:hypothetical protein